MNLPLDKPVWISHRGCGKSAVENTVEAFDAAVAEGFEVLETDLRLSRDGHLLLSHDASLGRLAGDDSAIAALTRAELSRISLRGGAKLLFFDELADRYGGLRFVLDIKPEEGEKTIAVLFDWSEKNHRSAWLQDRCRFLLWRPGHERLLKTWFPHSFCYAQRHECRRAGLAVMSGMPGLGGIVPGRTYALTAKVGPVSMFRPEKVRAYHRRGAMVIGFLPQTDGEARAAISAGVDEILTDGPILRLCPASYGRIP